MRNTGKLDSPGFIPLSRDHWLILSALWSLIPLRIYTFCSIGNNIAPYICNKERQSPDFCSSFSSGTLGSPIQWFAFSLIVSWHLIPTFSLSVCLSEQAISFWKGDIILAIFVASSNPSKYYQSTILTIIENLNQIW